MALIEIDGLPFLIAWWIWRTVSHNQRVYKKKLLWLVFTPTTWITWGCSSISKRCSMKKSHGIFGYPQQDSGNPNRGGTPFRNPGREPSSKTVACGVCNAMAGTKAMRMPCGSIWLGVLRGLTVIINGYWWLIVLISG